MKNQTHGLRNHFDEFVTYLEGNWKNFRISEFAQALGCSTESIRRWRLGQGEICSHEIRQLQKYYQANPLFLLNGTQPMRITGDVTIVTEPGVAYNSDSLNRIEELEKQLLDKERIIRLYENQNQKIKKS